MTANPTSATVEGEPVELLMRALSKFRVEDERDGMMRFKAELPPELGEPLMRALMRVEAELLLADAAGLGRGADERTHDSGVATRWSNSPAASRSVCRKGR